MKTKLLKKLRKECSRLFFIEEHKENGEVTFDIYFTLDIPSLFYRHHFKIYTTTVAVEKRDEEFKSVCEKCYSLQRKWILNEVHHRRLINAEIKVK